MKVTMSPIVAGLSGTAADAVAASWKGVQYIRKYVKPANPNTAAQQTVRQSMARIPRLWRSLDSDIHKALDDYATSVQMSGYNWFARTNRALEETYESDQLTPPNAEIDAPTSLTLTDSGAGSCTVQWTGGSQGSNLYIEIWSRRVDTNNQDTTFTQKSTETTLSSAGSTSISLNPNQTFRVIVCIKDKSNNTFSTCTSATIAMGA